MMNRALKYQSPLCSSSVLREEHPNGVSEDSLSAPQSAWAEPPKEGAELACLASSWAASSNPRLPRLHLWPTAPWEPSPGDSVDHKTRAAGVTEAALLESSKSKHAVLTEPPPPPFLGVHHASPRHHPPSVGGILDMPAGGRESPHTPTLQIPLMHLSRLPLPS